jgi:hypothetical protein
MRLTRATILPIALTALVFAGLGAFGGWWLSQPAKPAMDMDGMNHSSAAVTTTVTALQASSKCRAGAFMDAEKIIGAIVGASEKLPANTPPGARDHLHAALFVALKQAKDEAHCVAGVLPYGYDRTFINTIRRGMNLAKLRGLNKDFVQIGEDAIVILTAGKPSPR